MQALSPVLPATSQPLWTISAPYIPRSGVIHDESPRIWLPIIRVRDRRFRHPSEKHLTFVPGQPTRPQIVLHRSTWKDRRLVKFSPCRVVYNIPATCQPSLQRFSYWYALPKHPDSVVLAPAHLRSLLLAFSIIVPSSFTSFPMTFRPWCL